MKLGDFEINNFVLAAILTFLIWYPTALYYFSSSSSSSTLQRLQQQSVQNKSAMSKYSKFVLGRGCDPVRAAFAKKHWEPLLKAEVSTATSDEELLAHLTSGVKFDVFFLAPGMCSLISSGRINGKQLRELVITHQPQAKFINIEDVSDAIPKLTEALGLETGSVKSVNASSADWPFVD